MALTEIEYGSRASSEILNNNFNYLLSEIHTLAQTTDSNSGSISDLETSVSNLGTTLNTKANTSLNNLSSDGESRFNGKANTDLSNCSRPYVTERYDSGNYAWYRVYSDGFCEQGGFFTNAAGTVTLMKPYKNQCYSIHTQIMGTLSGGDNAACIMVYHHESNSQFQLYYLGRNVQTQGLNTYWRTAGYLW